MKLEIPYGKDEAQPLEVPERNFLAVVRPNVVDSGFEYEVDAIQQGIDAPIRSEHLEQFLEGAEDVVVIVNDGTRPTPTARVLDVLQTKMRLDSVRYLIATGAHRAPTEEELSNIFGDHLPKVRAMVHSHDSRKDKMVLLGRSKNGTDMWVNDIAVQADRLIIITSVEPHYFAGYTGGRKSFLPGVASYQTIEQNHRMAMRPESKILALEGNPVHEDMMDALKAVQRQAHLLHPGGPGPAPAGLPGGRGRTELFLQAGDGMGQRGLLRQDTEKGGRGGLDRPIPHGRRPVPVAEGAGQRQVGA